MNLCFDILQTSVLKFLVLFSDSAMPCWYFEKKEIRNTPSYKDGIDSFTECRYRREGARFIIDAGTKMGLYPLFSLLKFELMNLYFSSQFYSHESKGIFVLTMYLHFLLFISLLDKLISSLAFDLQWWTLHIHGCLWLEDVPLYTCISTVSP